MTRTEYASADATSSGSLHKSVMAAQLGDSNASEALARRFLRPAYLVALSIVRRPSDAEDVAQDALILALSKIENCRTPEAFAGWLMQIVRNQSRNFLEKRHFRDVSKEDEEEPPDNAPESASRIAIRQALLRALGHLSEVERAVVLLHDLEGYTHPEIAEALEISTVHSRQHLFLAREELRKRLEPAKPVEKP